MNFKIEKNVELKKLSTELKKLSIKFKKISTKLKTSTKIKIELNKQITKHLKRMASISAEDNKNHLTFLKRYAEAGWFFDVGNLAVGFMTKNINKPIHNNEIICNYVEKMSKDIDISIFCRKKQVIESIKLHNENRYLASIPLFFLTVEGEIKDILKEEKFPFSPKTHKLLNKNNFLKYITEIIKNHNDDFKFWQDVKLREIYIKKIKDEYNFYGVKLQEILKINKYFKSENEDMGICNENCNKCKMQNKFNRNMVMHGACPNYGTRINSAKAMSLLFLARMVISFKDYIIDEAKKLEKSCHRDLQKVLDIINPNKDR